MCRLFATAGGAAAAMGMLIEGVHGMRQLGFPNAHGSGIGWIDDVGRAHVAKAAMPSYAADLRSAVAEASASRAAVGHVRMATVGGEAIENTHPWQMQGRVAAHNGTIHGAEALDQLLGDYRDLVRGSTDSERLVALVARHADATGDVGEGLAAAARDVTRLGLPFTSLNMVVGTTDGVHALRHSRNRTLWFREQAGDAHAAGVLVASQPADAQAGWKLLKPGELLHARPDGSFVRRQVLPPPELHLPDPDMDSVAALATAAPARGSRTTGS